MQTFHNFKKVITNKQLAVPNSWSKHQWECRAVMDTWQRGEYNRWLAKQPAPEMSASTQTPQANHSPCGYSLVLTSGFISEEMCKYSWGWSTPRCYINTQKKVNSFWPVKHGTTKPRMCSLWDLLGPLASVWYTLSLERLKETRWILSDQPKVSGD